MRKERAVSNTNLARLQEKPLVQTFQISRNNEAERVAKLNLQNKRISRPVAKSQIDKSGN